MAGIYIHIPFCNSFCSYCNFYSVKGKRYREQYVAAIKEEIAGRKEYFKRLGVSPSTIYFGGGTPSVLSIDAVKEIFDTILKEFGLAPQEATIEVNPNDITLEYAKGLKEIGFNRISMGVQSFIDEHLLWMNRRHRSHEAIEAYYILRKAGFANISLDLIFGFSLLTTPLWEYNLSKIIDLKPNHISSYQLSIEPGSALSAQYSKNLYEPLDDLVCAQQYAILQQELSNAGYEQYEISNFALKESNASLQRSVHNSSYWIKEPYLGLGPAAHSYNGTERFWNTSSVVKYCKHYLDKDSSIKVSEIECLTPQDIFNESVMLGLRTLEGVNLSTLNPGFRAIIESDITEHIKRGNLIMEGDTIKIPSNKLFVSDGIIRDLFV